MPIRILMGKLGLDGHDRGAKVIVAALRDAGMEVIYTGLHKTPEQMVRAAIEEDVDVIGISILSGAHNTVIPKMIALLKKEKMSKIPVMVGGIIPAPDIAKLKKGGVKAVFGPGTKMDEVVDWVKKSSKKKG